jgi:hypothetical protein
MVSGRMWVEVEEATEEGPDDLIVVGEEDKKPRGRRVPPPQTSGDRDRLSA